MAKIRRALISVSDKDGIAAFAKQLELMNVEILSTGGTAALLRKNKIKVKDVSKHTGHPEILEGRVKTLHPKIHGGILALRDKKDHINQIKQYKIDLIDIVVVNLYPFQQTIEKSNVKLKDAIENIDIGGPSMIRSAAKNFKDVAVIVDPKDYPKVIDELKATKTISQKTREQLAVKAFEHTARYDSIISDYFHKKFSQEDFPETLTLSFEKLQNLRYGENPHQKGAFYKDIGKKYGIADAKQLHGKELSFNNILDLDSALDIVREFNEPAAAVIKHTNPCGASTRKNIDEALIAAYEVDPMAAFGCVIAINRPCTLRIAEYLRKKFIEAIICPRFEQKALALLQEKKNIRLLELKDIKPISQYDIKKVSGGLLVQTKGFPKLEKKMFRVVTKRKPTKKEIDDLIFAWKINKHVRSNALVFVKDQTAYGIGAGQMSRVDASKIAKIKSKGRAKNGVLSSDAFFPFRDGIDEAAKAGIKAIIQPGGSIRDKEAIKAANEHGMAMVFTGVRLFKH